MEAGAPAVLQHGWACLQHLVHNRGAAHITVLLCAAVPCSCPTHSNMHSSLAIIISQSNALWHQHVPKAGHHHHATSWQHRPLTRNQAHQEGEHAPRKQQAAPSAGAQHTKQPSATARRQAPPPSSLQQQQQQQGWSQDWVHAPAQQQTAKLPSGPAHAHNTSSPSRPPSAAARPLITSDSQQGKASSGVKPGTSPAMRRNPQSEEYLREQFASFGVNVNLKWVAAVASTRGMVQQLRFPSQVNASLPKLKAIVIVEGLADAAAVHKAVNAVVYVCDGSSVKSGVAAHALRVLSRWPWGLIVLTDPDAPGRELRMFLDDALVQQSLRQAATAGAVAVQPQQQELPQHKQQQQGQSNAAQRRVPSIKHAFVRVIHATAQEATKWHEAGSTGIENARPVVIQDSLRKARTSFAETRREFNVQELQQLGLANTFDAKQASGAKLRRQLLCDSLGIDNCTGKSLSTILNRFFERAEFDAALGHVNATLPLTDT